MPTREQRESSKRRKLLNLAWCSGCKREKPQTEFEKCLRRRPFGLCSLCIVCDNERKANQAMKLYWSMSVEDRYNYNRKSNIKRKFKISVEQYEELFVKQKGVCAICKNPETDINYVNGRLQKLAIDHNHNTKVIRGLLCAKCNKGLGSFRDDINYLYSAIDYLKLYETKVEIINE